MIVGSLAWTLIKWLLGILSYGVVIWLLPLIIVVVILSVMGVKIKKLGSAALKTIGNSIVSALTWCVERIPKFCALIKRFYFFLSKRCFGMLPSGVAKALAIIIIVII